MRTTDWLGNAELVSIPEQVFKSDYLYSVTATGDTIYTLSLSDVTVIGKYDFANNKFIETNTDSEQLNFLKNLKGIAF
ncbi:MAG: hypothetical protein IJ158_06795 [Treponema sp.]|nr:hypothetical protein [Treponema sp.]